MKKVIIILLICLLIFTLQVGSFYFVDPQVIMKLYVYLKGISPVYFCLLYFLCLILLVPGSPLAILCCVLYGFHLGILLNFIVNLAALIVSFIVARYCRFRVYQSNSILASILSRPDKNDWGLIFALRMNPILPVNIASYALGLTAIKQPYYYIISILCLLPYLFIYGYIALFIQSIVKEYLPVEALTSLALLTCLLSVLYLYRKYRG